VCTFDTFKKGSGYSMSGNRLKDILFGVLFIGFAAGNRLNEYGTSETVRATVVHKEQFSEGFGKSRKSVCRVTTDQGTFENKGGLTNLFFSSSRLPSGLCEELQVGNQYHLTVGKPIFSDSKGILATAAAPKNLPASSRR
jgi:hypothetical protein